MMLVVQQNKRGQHLTDNPDPTRHVLRPCVYAWMWLINLSLAQQQRPLATSEGLSTACSG
jgi:hypothetical protein